MLHPRERSDPRAQLVRMDRLGEELVGARFDAADAIRQIGLAGHQDDRRQPRRRVGLEPTTDFQPVHPRHRDVEQDDVGLVLAARRRARRRRRWR